MRPPSGRDGRPTSASTVRAICAPVTRHVSGIYEPGMPSMYDPRERAVEAARLLNYFLSDFIDGIRALETFPKFEPSRVATALNRMAISHLVVALSKWTEFYQRYRAILPNDVRAQCSNLHGQIMARGVMDFRNTVVGHILDKATNQPLTSREIDERLERVIGGDRDAFLRWIYDPSNNRFPCTVTAITRHVRDKLCTVYNLHIRPYEVPYHGCVAL